MLTRVLTLSAALLAALTAAGWTTAATGSTLAWMGVALLGLGAFARPAAALLALAALGPLGGAIAALAGWRVSAAEPLAWAVLAGWLAREAWDAGRWDRLAVALAGLMALTVATSLAVQCVVVYQVAAPADLSPARAALGWLTLSSAVPDLPWRPEVERALGLLAGCGLFLMAATVGRRGEATAAGVARMLALGVAGVAVLNANRFVEIALRRGPDFWSAAVEAHQTLRISSTIPDVNAAAALFALVLPLLAAQALSARRMRALWIAAGVVVLGALWLTGSRAGMAGGIVGLMAYGGAQAARGGRRRAVAGGLAVTVMAVAALLIWYPRPAVHVAAADAWTIRWELGRVAMRMAGEAPLLGAGIGRFRAESARLATPALRRYYRSENAHNQLAQVVGELGLVGAVLFVALAGSALVPAVRRWIRGDRTDPGLSLTAGLGGFLLAGLLMHPLLLPEVALAFWIALGLTRAVTAGAGDPRPARRPVGRVLAAVAALGLAASVAPRAAQARRTADLEGRSVGLSAWRVDRADGRGYRATRGDSILYVSGLSPQLRLALRAQGGRAVTPAGRVTIVIDGRVAGKFDVATADWTPVAIHIPAAGPGGPRFRRVDLRWSPARAGRALRVWQPEIVGTP